MNFTPVCCAGTGLPGLKAEYKEND